MAFEEVQFPDNISFGSVGGPGFDTSVIVLDSGQEERVARRQQMRHQWNARYGIRSQQDVYAVKEFYAALTGVATGFRFKDWTDYASTATGSTHLPNDAAVDDEDVIIGTGNGANKSFQLVKYYVQGTLTHTRTIKKPVNGSVVIAVNGVAKTESVDYTVNYTTGVVLFTTAPPNTQDVTAGFQFDVPSRFGVEIDTELSISIDAFDPRSIPDIPIVEILEDDEQPVAFWYGGAKEHGTVSANVQITLLDGRVQTFDPQTGSLEIQLPSVTLIAAGGPHFALFNDNGTNSMTVKDFDGNTVGTLATDGSLVFFLSKSPGGTKRWLALA